MRTTGSDGIWAGEGHSFWRIMMRSQQRRYSGNSGGIPGRGQTGGFLRFRWRAGAAAGAAADAAVGLAVGGLVVVLIQGL